MFPLTCLERPRSLANTSLSWPRRRLWATGMLVEWCAVLPASLLPMQRKECTKSLRKPTSFVQFRLVKLTSGPRSCKGIRTSNCLRGSSSWWTPSAWRGKWPASSRMPRWNWFWPSSGHGTELWNPTTRCLISLTLAGLLWNHAFPSSPIRTKDDRTNMLDFGWWAVLVPLEEERALFWKGRSTASPWAKMRWDWTSSAAPSPQISFLPACSEPFIKPTHKPWTFSWPSLPRMHRCFWNMVLDLLMVNIMSLWLTWPPKATCLLLWKLEAWSARFRTCRGHHKARKLAWEFAICAMRGRRWTRNLAYQPSHSKMSEWMLVG